MNKVAPCDDGRHDIWAKKMAWKIMSFILLWTNIAIQQAPLQLPLLLLVARTKKNEVWDDTPSRLCTVIQRNMIIWANKRQRKHEVGDRRVQNRIQLRGKQHELKLKSTAATDNLKPIAY